MRIDELHYDLPETLIAQRPAEPRDASRLLVLDRDTGQCTHTQFSRLLEWLRPGDCLVLNQTRVIPARFFARRQTGGRVEGLFLGTTDNGAWQVLLKPSARLKPGEPLAFDPGPGTLTLVESRGQGHWVIQSDETGPAHEVLERVGQTPLPPYIKRSQGDPQDTHDRQRYQTVYAAEPGAVAAPTAGLHFTRELLDAAQQVGLNLARVTLHVGLGTFKPITVDSLDRHEIHQETYWLDDQTADLLNRTRAEGGRIVCVGTTSVRVIETCAASTGLLEPAHGQTRLFIYPPYRFRAVDAMITNFHLPGSTLLALVFAFASREQILDAYQQAIDQRYRFYSYGDAMLIL